MHNSRFLKPLDYIGTQIAAQKSTHAQHLDIDHRIPKNQKNVDNSSQTTTKPLVKRIGTFSHSELLSSIAA